MIEQGTGSATDEAAVAQTATGAYYPQGREVTAQTWKGRIADSALNGIGLGTDQGTAGGLMSSLANFNPVGSFMNQAKYGMNDAAKQEYQRVTQKPANSGLSQAELVNLARAPQMARQLPHAMNPQQRAAAGLPPTQMGNNPVNAMVSGEGGSLVPLGGATIPNGDVQGGQFKPVTFRSGTGTATLTPEGLTTELAEPYANLSNLVGEGQGLMGEAAGLAQQAPDQFNYGFDPSGRAQELMAERSALLEPAFAKQRSAMNEGMFGSGRLGLRLSGEGQGAGGGMVQPDAFGMNQAQSQALAQLAAQSSTDAFGESMQRAGLDLSQFGANQGTKQQQYANLAGMGQGMLSAGLQAPALEQGLFGAPLAVEGLRQNYELGLEKNDISRMLAEAQANRANYQPNPWLSGLTSAGTAFLGTNTGSDWLSGLFSGW